MPTEQDQAGATSSVILLTCAQGLAGAIPPIMVSLGGLVGQSLAENKALVTLPVSSFMIGTATATLPVAALVRRFGRKTVYVGGALIAAAGGLISAWGVISASFVLFCLGGLLFGLNVACVQSYRFTAAASVRPERRARAISLVMAGGLGSAIIGPQIVIWTRDIVPGIQFAGSFIGQTLLALATIPFLASMAYPAIPRHTTRGSGRPLMQIVMTPRFIAASGAGIVSYGTMSFMMTAAPIAMIGCGFGVGEAALGIQWHVLSMFAPSFVTGRLIDRFGKEWITLLGLVLIACGAVIALSGTTIANFWVTLVLLGVGWNFGFLGATTMVTDCHAPEEASKVQGLNDFIVFGSVAAASLASGGIVHSDGWTTINWLVLSAVGAGLLFLLYGAMQRRPA
ncbi:MFS transporter [Afipia sp. P52-10]|uniref:MFS transporter n=1 Tax=Afipia sp. P52-10 TaxID=1429916 RepID=UPI0003DF06D9|nr:MFS transporter [Afipia sp. P52-10]ETR76967.1 MFS transporter [Afipia sp. P52-10]